MQRFVNASGSASTGSDEAAKPQRGPQAFSAENLQGENDKKRREKGSHAIDFSDSGLTQRKIVLDVPPDVVQAISDLRPLRRFKTEIPKRPSFLQV